MKLFYKFFPTHAARYTLCGVLLGLFFPVAAVLTEARQHATTGFLEAHIAEPLLWVIDTVPLFVGLFAFLAGRQRDQIDRH